MATNAPQDEYQKTALRLPKELHAAVHREAAESGRSYNSQLIYIVQEYFDQIERGAAELKKGLERRQEEFVSFGLGDAADRDAVLKVLLLEEISLLRRRIERLGGRDAVLGATKADVVRRAGEERIQGTQGDRQSHFSATVGSWPLTALLTSDELSRLAQRIVAVQDAMSTGRPDADGAAEAADPKSRVDGQASVAARESDAGGGTVLARLAALAEKERTGTMSPAEKQERNALAHGQPWPDKRTSPEPAPAPGKKGSFSHLSRGKKLGK